MARSSCLTKVLGDRKLIRRNAIALLFVAAAFLFTLFLQGFFPYPFLFLFFAAVMALGGCATPPKPPSCMERPSRFEACADHCAVTGGGDPLLWENKSDSQCMCRRHPEGT